MKKFILSLSICLFFAGYTHAQIDRSQRPVPGSAPTVNLETPQTFTLDNGMKVMVVRNTKLPRVRIQLLLDNPPYAAGDKAGVQDILAGMLGNGTTSISKDDFNDEVDFMGASINFGSQSGFAFSLSRYFDRVFELFADAATNALLTEDEFNSVKSRVLDGLRTQERDVSSVSRNVARALLFGKEHPFGEFTTIQSVENVTFSDVVDYYNSFFSPQNAYLVVVGDVDASRVRALANMHFAQWPNRGVSVYTYSNPKDLPGMQINFIDMPNAVQSELVVQNVKELKMSDEDFFPMLIANNILGGDFNSYLNMNLREDKGWTYGARSSVRGDKHVGRFIASTSVRNEVTDSAVVEMIREIRNIRENLVENDKLATAKAVFTGNFVMALERPETVANYALNIATQKLSDNFYENYLRKINAVTAQDVKRVANKYFNIDHARIVVTGRGADVLEGLKNIDRGDGGKIPVRFFDRFGNEVAEPNYNIELDPSVTVDYVLNKYVETIGGKNKLNSVNTIYTSAEATMQGMPITMEVKQASGNKMAQSMSAMGMVLQKTVFNGETGYMEAQGQRMDLEESQIKDMKENGSIFPELNPANAVLKGIENIDGEMAYAVAFGDAKVSFYSVETGLKIKDDTVQEMQGTEIRSSVYYAEYQEVNGIKFPHQMTILAGPQEIVFNISSIKINEGVSAEDFN